MYIALGGKEKYRLCVTRPGVVRNLLIYISTRCTEERMLDLDSAVDLSRGELVMVDWAKRQTILQVQKLLKIQFVKPFQMLNRMVILGYLYLT